MTDQLTPPAEQPAPVERDSAELAALEAFWKAWTFSGIADYDPIAIGAPVQATRHLATPAGGSLIDVIDLPDRPLRYAINRAGCAVLGKPFPGDPKPSPERIDAAADIPSDQPSVPFDELTLAQSDLLCKLWDIFGTGLKEWGYEPAPSETATLRALVDAWYLASDPATGMYSFVLTEAEMQKLCSHPVPDFGTPPTSDDDTQPIAFPDEDVQPLVDLSTALPVLLDDPGVGYRAEIADLEKQNADLRAQLADALTVNRLQSDMLKAASRHGKPRIEVKTLIQNWINGEKNIGAADREFQEHLNEGWTIVDITVSSYVFDGTVSIDRIVTLQRINEPAPAPDPIRAAAAIVDQVIAPAVDPITEFVNTLDLDDEPEPIIIDDEFGRIIIDDAPQPAGVGFHLDPARFPISAKIREQGAAAVFQQSINNALAAGQAAYEAALGSTKREFTEIPLLGGGGGGGGMDHVPASLTAQIEQWQAQIAALDPSARAAKLEEAQNALGTAYYAAEARGDEQTMALTATAWQHIQHIAEQADQAHSIASGSTTAASEIASEHARLLKEHEDLLEAIDSYDWNHPKIEPLLEMAEESVADQVLSGWYDYENETIADEIRDSLTRAMGMSEQEAGVFVDALINGTWGVTVHDCDLMIAYFMRLRVELDRADHPRGLSKLGADLDQTDTSALDSILGVDS